MCREASPRKMAVTVFVVLLSCWFASVASGQRLPQPQQQQAQPKQQPYYRDALPRSAPAIPRYYPPAPVHYVSIGDKLDGEYKFGYDSGTGPAGQSYRQEFRLPDGSIQGSYGYVDSRGHMRKVYYSAGKGGFVILKDERILDKEPGKAEPLVTTPGPRKVEDVVPEEQEVLQREPQTQHQTRRAAPVAPVPLPQKTAQEIQAEYARSQLFAEPTVARQQYAEPDAEAPPATEAPPPKPRPSRPRTGRRRKRPKKTSTTTTTTEAPVEEVKSEEVTGGGQPVAAAEPPQPPQPQPSPPAQRSHPFLRPRKLERPPLAHLPPPGQRQTAVQGPPPLQAPALDQGPPLAQFPIPIVTQRPPLQQRPQQAPPEVDRPVQGHGAPQVIQRQPPVQRRPPPTTAPPPIQQRQPQVSRDIEVQRPQQHIFGGGQRQHQAARVPNVQRVQPSPPPEQDEDTYVPPPALVDSTHGLSQRGSQGFGQRLSTRRPGQAIVAQSDQSRDPDVQAEQRPAPPPRQRIRYRTTKRPRRPTLSIESEFADQVTFPVTRAPHRGGGDLASKRRRVKFSRPAQLSQVSPLEDATTTPEPSTTTTSEPPPTTTTSVVTPPVLPAFTVGSTPQLGTTVFPSAEQSFFRTHGLPQSPFSNFGLGVTEPQESFTQPSAFTSSVALQETQPVTPAPRQTPAPQEIQPARLPQRTLVQPTAFEPQQGLPFRQPGSFSPPQQNQVPLLGQPQFLPGQAPPNLNSPYPQRPVYQLPGFTPGQRLPVQQHYLPPVGSPFVSRNDSLLAQDGPIRGQGRTVPIVVSERLPVRNRTSEILPLPVQRFVDYPQQGGLGQQGGFRQQAGFGLQQPPLQNPFSSVQPAHVFGAPPPGAPPFRGYPGQFSDGPFRGPPPSDFVEPAFRRQSSLTLPNQPAASPTTPSPAQQSTYVTEATPVQGQLNDLGTTPLSLSTPSTPAEDDQYDDEAGTTLQLPTAAPPASSFRTLSSPRTTAAPFEYQTARPPVSQYQTPGRESVSFATSPVVPQYQTTPRPAAQFQQSLEPEQRPTPAPPLSQPPAPASPPAGQSSFRLGLPQQHQQQQQQQQQQQNAINAQPQFNSIGGPQQAYDPYQQFGGGFQVGNNLYSPVQQSSQDLGGGYQLPDSGPFQAQFGSPYQPQYTTVDGYGQYQTTPGLGDIRGSGSNQQGTVQGYRSTSPPIIDRTLLSYDIGVPYGS